VEEGVEIIPDVETSLQKTPGKQEKEIPRVQQ
jgi:hypothetical protein